MSPMKRSKDKTLLVTAPASAKRQRKIAELVSGSLSVIYINDFPPGQQYKAFDAADMILSLNPLNEFDKKEYKFLNDIEFMQLLSAGMDHLPLDLLPETLAVAGNTGAYAIPMAEHALGMILSLAKRLIEEDRNMRDGKFDQKTRNLLLHGKDAAILGFGGVGSEVARLLQAFGMNIRAMNTSGRTEKRVDFIGNVKDLRLILQNAHVVVISLPLTNKTRSLIGKKELEWMRPDTILINIARGEIIDQADLYNHLKQYPSFKAGIESWWVEPFRHGRFELKYPLLELPNILASPHNSAMVDELSDYALENAFRNIDRYLKGSPVQGLLQRADYITGVENGR